MTPAQLTRVQAREAILARVRQLLIEQLHVRREPDEIDPDCPLFATGLGLDSVDAVELVVGLETEFSLLVPDGPAARRSLRTVNTLVDHILAAMAAQETSHAG